VGNREVTVILGSAVEWQRKRFWEGVSMDDERVRIERMPGAGLYLAGWEEYLWGDD